MASKKRISLIIPKMIVFVLLIVLAVVVGFVFNVILMKNVRNHDALEDRMEYLDKRFEQLFDDKNSLNLIYSDLNETDARINYFETRGDDLNLKFESYSESQKSVNGLMRNEMVSIKEKFAGIGRKLSEFELSQNNSFRESEETLTVLRDKFQSLQKSIEKSLDKKKYKSERIVRQVLDVQVLINRMASLHNGDLAVAGEFATLQIWDTKNGTLKHTLYGHSGEVETVATLPNGNFISTCNDRTLKIWTEDGKLVQTLNYDTVIVEIVVFSNGYFAGATVGRQTMFWTNNAILINTVYGQAFRMIVLANDILVTMPAEDNHVINMWNCEGVLQKTIFVEEPGVKLIAHDINGDFLTFSEHFVFNIWSQDGELRDTFSIDFNAVGFLAVLPNGDLAFSAGKNIFIYDRYSAMVKSTLDYHTDYVTQMFVMPNGDWATTAFDRTVRIWTR